MGSFPTSSSSPERSIPFSVQATFRVRGLRVGRDRSLIKGYGFARKGLKHRGASSLQAADVSSLESQALRLKFLHTPLNP